MELISITNRGKQALLIYLSRPSLLKYSIVILKVAVVINLILVSAMYTKYFMFNQATASLVKQNQEAVLNVIALGPETELFVQKLKDNGHKPMSVAVVKRKPFTVEGRLITLDGDNIQVFEYLDYKSAANDASILADKYISSTRSSTWKKDMHIYLNDKLVVFYMGHKKGIMDSLEKNAGLSLTHPKKVTPIATVK